MAPGQETQRFYMHLLMFLLLQQLQQENAARGGLCLGPQYARPTDPLWKNFAAGANAYGIALFLYPELYILATADMWLDPRLICHAGLAVW